jgi:hypothetical protein
MQQFNDITQNNPKTTANIASIYELAVMQTQILTSNNFFLTL